MIEPFILEADLVWTGERFEEKRAVTIDAGGIIRKVAPVASEQTVHPPGHGRRALLPGFINVHSHAFQRGLRGLGEHFPEGAGSFWTWREVMYELVAGMDAKSFLSLTRQAFEEMLAAGITTVGEFHYFHHDASLKGFAFDELVLRAARETGIRLVLLNTFYQHGGMGQPLAPAQQRFATPSVPDFWRQIDRLQPMCAADTQQLGVAAHSIRAVGLEEISALYQECGRRGMVFHIHVEEQRREIEACLAATGKRPLELLNERLDVGPAMTIVHATHSDPTDMSQYLSAGGNVCLCPLTEANLGDGIADLPGMLAGFAPLAVGTDSNNRLCMLEELRWLEYVQRLVHEKRGVCVDRGGRVAGHLLTMATVNGARSLGLDAGRIAPGMPADLVAVDLDADALRGWTPENLLDMLIFGAGNRAIAGTCVGGRWVYRRDGEA